MSLAADTRLGSYEIVSTLGAGGMGEVYRTESLWGRLISLSRDGKRLVYLGSQSEGDVWLMTLSPQS